jgi:hypothetical protein
MATNSSLLLHRALRVRRKEKRDEYRNQTW